jgi:hypothetical protein
VSLQNAILRIADGILVVGAQSYLGLAFPAIVAESARSIVGIATRLIMWYFWFSAFLVAAAPVMIASQAATEHYDQSARSTLIASALTLAGFFIFAIFIGAASWGWD